MTDHNSQSDKSPNLTSPKRNSSNAEPETQPDASQPMKKRPGCVTAYAMLLAIGAGLIGLGSLFVGFHRELGRMVYGLVLAVLCSLLARGLWRLKNWARIIAIVLHGLGVVSGLVAMLSGSAAGLLTAALWGIVLVWFISNDEHFD